MFYLNGKRAVTQSFIQPQSRIPLPFGSPAGEPLGRGSESLRAFSPRLWGWNPCPKAVSPSPSLRSGEGVRKACGLFSPRLLGKGAVLPAPPLRGVAGGQPVVQRPWFVCFISAVFLLLWLVTLWFCGFSFFTKERKIRRKRKKIPIKGDFLGGQAPQKNPQITKKIPIKGDFLGGQAPQKNPQITILLFLFL